MGYPARQVLNVTSTQSVAVGTSQPITVDVDNEAWMIKSIDLTPSANSSVTQISLDGRDTGLTAATNDVEAVFGSMPFVKNKIVVTVDNAGAGAEDITIVIKGIRYV